MATSQGVSPAPASPAKIRLWRLLTMLASLVGLLVCLIIILASAA